MKTVRNNLWMMIIAWTLIIEGKEILGVVVALLASIYLFFNKKSINIRNMSLLVLLLFPITVLFLKMTYLKISFLSIIFILIQSIDVSLIYQYELKIKLKSLSLIFSFLLVSYVLMFIVICILPGTIMNINSKVMAISLISTVFMPYSLIILTMLVKKEYLLRKRRNYLRTLKNRSMFNIKA